MLILTLFLSFFIARHLRFTGSWRSALLGSRTKTALLLCPLALPLKQRRRMERGPTLWEPASFSSQWCILVFSYMQKLCGLFGVGVDWGFWCVFVCWGGGGGCRMLFWDGEGGWQGACEANSFNNMDRFGSPVRRKLHETCMVMRSPMPAELYLNL